MSDQLSTQKRAGNPAGNYTLAPRKPVNANDRYGFRQKLQGKSPSVSERAHDLNCKCGSC